VETWSETISFLGFLVLVYPVWKGNRVARRIKRVQEATVAEGSSKIFDTARKALEAAIEPDEWTHRDQVVLNVGYLLALSGQCMTFLY
jgi:hypothetical protein